MIKITLLINKNIIITHILLFSNNISINKIQKELNQSIVFESVLTEIDNNQNTKEYMKFHNHYYYQII